MKHDEENEIVNRHLYAMMAELRQAGFKPNGAVAFIAFEGFDYHLAIAVDEVEAEAATSRKPSITPEKYQDLLLRYAADEMSRVLAGQDRSRERGLQ